MFGKIGDIGGMMKKAYEMKKELGKIQEELADVEVKGICGTSVEVTATADMKIKRIRIAPEAVNSENAEELENLVLTAVNDALDEARKVSQQKMAQVTGGLNLPGLFG
jgi:DNA-binding YbaB/EbfC family protein